MMGRARVLGRTHTGHEQVDQVNLIHMGGRVYDPHIGRFLSADPLVQAPHLSQSYNRYSYVLNNPMNYVDPSGYSGISDNWRTIAAIAVAWAVPHMLVSVNALTAKVVAGMAAGAVQSGTLKRALMGGFSAGMFHGIGAHLDGLASTNLAAGPPAPGTLVAGIGLTPGQFAGKIAAHASAGGVMSVLQGGKFGHGFASAGFGEALSPAVMLNATSPFKQFAVGVVIGGTTSRIAGGKFSNGAVTAAFQWAFNHNGRRNATREEDRENMIRQDLSLILDEFNAYVAEATEDGRRTYNYVKNNILGSWSNWSGDLIGRPYLGCYEQADELEVRLDAIRPKLNFN